MTEPDLEVEQERIEKIEAMFEAPTLRRRLRALVTGLRQPRGKSGLLWQIAFQYLFCLGCLRSQFIFKIHCILHFH